MKLTLAGVLLLVFHATPLEAQSTRSLINDGNDLYEEKKYEEAELQYRKALNEDQESVAGTFNLGNALNKQGKHEQAVSEFESAVLKAEEKETRAGAYYNRGNSFLEGSQLDQAISSYVEALKLNPADQDAKYNLSYALMKRQQQQQQNKNKDNRRYR